jgi:hypothetical protein
VRLSAGGGVEDRGVLGAHVLGANVCVVTPPYLSPHRSVSFPPSFMNF